MSIEQNVIPFFAKKGIAFCLPDGSATAPCAVGWRTVAATSKKET
jgi:hypothetical protein